MRTGKIIRRLRERAELTQQNAADLLRVDQAKISRVENGRQDLYTEEFIRWVTTLSKVRKVASFTMDGFGRSAIKK